MATDCEHADRVGWFEGSAYEMCRQCGHVMPRWPETLVQRPEVELLAPDMKVVSAEDAIAEIDAAFQRAVAKVRNRWGV